MPYPSLHNQKACDRAALRIEHTVTEGLLEDIKAATNKTAAEFAVLTPVDQLAELGFAHTILGQCYQHRAEHGLY